MSSSALTTQIVVRMTPQLRKELEEVAQASAMSLTLADHVRYAIERYVRSQQAENGGFDEDRVAVAPI